MNLARHSLDNAPTTSLHSVTFTHDQRHFVALEEDGYSIWRTNPLRLLRRRDLEGSLANVLPLPNTSLLALQGGGNSPLYPPNKVVIYHDSLPSLPCSPNPQSHWTNPVTSPSGQNPPLHSTDPPNPTQSLTNNSLGRPIASLEFRSRIRGLAARNGSLFVVLRDRVVWFDYGMNDDRGGEAAAQEDREDGFAAMEMGSVAGHERGKGKGKAREIDHREGFWIKKRNSWQTCDNEKGLVAVSTAPGSSTLAIPGRQPGHVQLIRLDPCPATSTLSHNPGHHAPSNPPPSNPTLTITNPNIHSPILITHTHPLSSLSISPSGQTLITASSQGTLLRMWDVESGRLERELRRGLGGADVWGVGFGFGLGFGRVGDGGDEDQKRDDDEVRDRIRSEERSLVVGWSDKGTIHVWGSSPLPTFTTASSHPSPPSKPNTSTTPSPNPRKTKIQKLSSLLDPHLPLPRYFRSQPSFALFRLGREMSPAGSGGHTHSFAVTKAEAETELDRGVGIGGDGGAGERFVVVWVEVEEGEKGIGETGGRDAGRRGEKASKITASRSASGTGKIPAPNKPSSRPGSGHGIDNQNNRTGPKPSETSNRDRDQPSKSKPTAKADGNATDTGQAVGTKTKSLQLIAITFAGDWYRIGLPPADAGHEQDDRDEASASGKAHTDPERRADRCVLLEYRRMQTSVDGW